jgi:adenine-specific DNA-methyltransferase
MKTNEYRLETLKYISETSLEYRKKMGQFFTPRSLREELLSKIPKLEKPKVLDPACGTGEFLLSAKDYFKDPELYCWEIDPKLVEIAKKLVPEAHFEQVDSLTKPFKEEFDVVIGNPPYFEFKPDISIETRYKEIIWGRVNIYSLFIYLGLKLLKPEGYLAYVVSSSMNNGAYFKKLREFIVRNADIIYMKILEDPYLFKEVNHTFQLLVLKKTFNTGRYVFRKNNIIIFSEKAEKLKQLFDNATTLKELGYKVLTGRVVWNQNKDKLTDDPSRGILLIWAHNVKNGKLELNNNRRPQYIIWDKRKADKGPAIVVTRIVGHPKKARIEAAIVPSNIIFVAENHVNVIYPPPNTSIEELEEIVKQLNSEETQKLLSLITGNTQISKNELENLFPIKLSRSKYTGLSQYFLIKDVKTRSGNTLKNVFPMKNYS